MFWLRLASSTKASGPEGFHKLVLGNDLSTVTNEDQQSFKDFRCDGHRLVFAQENLLLRVNPKRSELVEDFWSCGHIEEVGTLPPA
jgi:hypothetical protein